MDSNIETNPVVEKMDRLLRRRLKIVKRTASTETSKQGAVKKQRNKDRKRRSSRKRVRRDNASTVDTLLKEAHEKLQHQREQERRNRTADASDSPCVRTKLGSAKGIKRRGRSAYASQPARLTRKKHSKISAKAQLERAPEKEPPIAQLALLAKLSSI